MPTTRIADLTGSAANSFQLARMRGHEELGRPFEFELELLSDDDKLDLSQFLGAPMTVRIELPPGGYRYFNGLVTKIWLAGSEGRYVRYRATLQPWLSVLRHKRDSRIFQTMSVPDIVKQVFGGYGFADFSDNLQNKSYRKWDYLVQYGESDFNFVSRILELEGIYYYFEHADGKHTLVLTDADPAVSASNYDKVPYHTEGSVTLDREYIDEWSMTQRLVSGSYTATDFNFETPRTPLLQSTGTNPTGGAHDDLEVFEYPGGFFVRGDGQTVIRVRLQEQQLDYQQFSGGGSIRGLSAGCTFTLEEFPRDDQNQKYFIIANEYDIASSPQESGMARTALFRCAFSAIKSGVPYRPARTTPKPKVEGPQTAFVVGPAGEEIWTDKYGRIKLQFPWDRYGKSDDKSSFWVRVAQTWAGPSWGAIQTPRIGQEVVVEFLEGDPDRPIVTGSVYNGVNMPPYSLPSKKTQSGVKTRSSKGGNLPNANEIRFEDLKGSEELYVHAEKDQTTEINNNQTITVGADQSITVKGTRTTTIEKKETQAFKDARVKTVDQTEDETVQKKYTGTYHGGREVKVDGDDEKLTVDGADMAVVVHGQYDITADTHLKVTQNNDSLLMQDKFQLQSAGAISIKNDQCSVTLDSGKITLTAQTEITLTCGQSSLTMKADGTIAISGAQKVSVASSPGSVEVGPATTKVAGTMVQVSGSATTEIKGAMVTIN